MSPEEHQLRLRSHRTRSYRRRLPHCESEGATYFLTYRLAGSLPGQVVAEIRNRFAVRMKSARQIADPLKRSAEESAVRDEMHDATDRYLGAGYGPCHLADERIASMVAENLFFHAGRKYSLHRWVIMPNHLHLLLAPLIEPESGGTWPLREVIHSLRSYTAHRAVCILNIAGTFWQREYYDRLIRDEADFAAKAAYIENNPVAAGLCRQPSDWRWSSAYREVFS